MSTTIAFESDLLLLDLTQQDTLPIVSATKALADKPGFFARMLEAFGRAYCVPMPDSTEDYVFPPI